MHSHSKALKTHPLIIPFPFPYINQITSTFPCMDPMAWSCFQLWTLTTHPHSSLIYIFGLTFPFISFKTRPLSVLHFYIWTQWHVHISICSMWTLKKHPHTHFWCPRRRDPEPMCGCSFTVVELIYYVACRLAPFTQQEL